MQKEEPKEEEEEESPHVTALVCLLVLGKDTGMAQHTPLSLYCSESASLSSLCLSLSPSRVLVFLSLSLPLLSHLLKLPPTTEKFPPLSLSHSFWSRDAT